MLRQIFRRDGWASFMLAPRSHDRASRIVLYLSLLTTSILCIYLLVSDSGAVPYGSERLYWEYAGRIIGTEWTQGYVEWLHERAGDLPALPSEAALLHKSFEGFIM
jgi:hypothetical protein